MMTELNGRNHGGIQNNTDLPTHYSAPRKSVTYTPRNPAKVDPRPPGTFQGNRYPEQIKSPERDTEQIRVISLQRENSTLSSTDFEFKKKRNQSQDGRFGLNLAAVGSDHVKKKL